MKTNAGIEKKLFMKQHNRNQMIIRVTLFIVFIAGIALMNVSCSGPKQAQQSVSAPKPLFADPVYDGAADPVIVWNKKEQKWFMLYTNRRATMTDTTGVK